MTSLMPGADLLALDCDVQQTDALHPITLTHKRHDCAPVPSTRLYHVQGAVPLNDLAPAAFHRTSGKLSQQPACSFTTGLPCPYQTPRTSSRPIDMLLVLLVQIITSCNSTREELIEEFCGPDGVEEPCAYNKQGCSHTRWKLVDWVKKYPTFR